MLNRTSCFILLFWALTTFISYGQSTLPEKESYIIKNIRSNPDLVKKLVREVLNDEKLPDTTIVNMYIYYGYAHNLLNAHDSAIYFYKKSLYYSDGYPKYKAKAYLNLGIQYRKITKYDTALQYLKQSETLNRESGNKNGLAMVYGELASVYNQQGYYEWSIDYLLKALEIFKESNNPNLINPIRQRLAGTYVGTKNYAFAADIYSDVLPFFKSQKSKNYYITLANYGECLYFLKKYDMAENALNEALPGLAKFQDEETSAIASSWLGAIAFIRGDSKKGEYLYNKSLKILYTKNSFSLHTITGHYLSHLNQLGRYDKAAKVIAYSEKMLKAIAINTRVTAELEAQKAITYKNINDKDKSIASLEMALKLKDSVDYAKNYVTLNRLQAQYQNKLQREKNISLATNNKFLNVKVKNKALQNIIVTGLFILALAFIVWGYTLYLLRKKLQEENLENLTARKKIVIDKYQKEQENNSHLKKTLLIKQTNLLEGAMKLAQVKENINEMLDVVKDKGGEVDTVFLTNKLEKLVRQEDYWEVFDKNFNEAHPQFKMHLQMAYPHLNKTDLFFASLLKLKLPYKEIGRLMVISPESVAKRKYRLKKKMNIESDEEFDVTLSQM